MDTVIFLPKTVASFSKLFNRVYNRVLEIRDFIVLHPP